MRRRQKVNTVHATSANRIPNNTTFGARPTVRRSCDDERKDKYIVDRKGFVAHVAAKYPMPMAAC
jgi:hypothetical protein